MPGPSPSLPTAGSRCRSQTIRPETGEACLAPTCFRAFVARSWPARSLPHFDRCHSLSLTGILIPRTHEPVGRDGNRQRAPGHESEVPRTRRGDDARSRVCHELADHTVIRSPPFRQGAPEGSSEVGHRGSAAHRPVTH